MGTMERQLEESLIFFAGISGEKSQRRYAAGKWSIRQVLNHVNDTERMFGFRALWFARGFEIPLTQLRPGSGRSESAVFCDHLGMKSTMASRISGSTPRPTMAFPLDAASAN